MAPPTMKDPVADEFLTRGLAPTSAKVYSRAIRQLDRWCAENGTTLAKITASELVAFQQWHPMGRENAKLLRQALRHWWALHPRRRRPPFEAIRVPRKPRYRCRALDVPDADLLEAAARSRHDRPGVAVLVGMYLGLRRAEIARLRWADLSGGWVKVLGKGGVVAELPLHPVLVEALDHLERHPSGWLFPGANGPVVPTTVWTWVRKVAEEAGLDAVTTHRLRHTALATANDETKDLRAVQEFARHARPETTALYTRVTAKRLVEVAMAINYGGDHG